MSPTTITLVVASETWIDLLGLIVRQSTKPHNRLVRPILQVVDCVGSSITRASRVVIADHHCSTESPSSRGLGRGPFKAETRVRIPVGTPPFGGPFRLHGWL